MLNPNHLQIKEKVICIYLIPAGCNLYYQAVQRLNATSIKFEETRYQSLTFTLRLRTIFLTCISNNWIILIKDNSTLYWQENMLQEHSRARGSHKLLQNLRIGEIAHNACRVFFFSYTSVSVSLKEMVFIVSCTKRTWLIPRVMSHFSMQCVVVVIRVASERQAEKIHQIGSQMNWLVSPASWSVFWSTEHFLISWSC